MRKLVLIGTLVMTTCTPAYADNQVIWGQEERPLSMIRVEELEKDPEGCVAKVWFKNWNLHDVHAANIWDLDMYDTQVRVELEVDPYGPDTMIVTTPEGYFTWPDHVVVPEDTTDYICVYQDGGLNS